jgi:hypothetical protein
MQPETEVEAKAWFQKAANDLRGAEIDLAAAPPLIEDALFHCQQAPHSTMKCTRCFPKDFVRRSIV